MRKSYLGRTIAVLTVGAFVGLVAFAPIETDVSESSADAAQGANPASSVAIIETGGTPSVNDQLAYVHSWWNKKNLESYGYIPDNDCANFASQSLAARGWMQDDNWSMVRTGQGTSDIPDNWVFDATPAWVSSTALSRYLEARPSKAHPLDDTQRADLKPGDIVQFDFDPSATPEGAIDRDHTGVVTRLEATAEGIRVFYAAHTQGVRQGADTPTFNTEYYSVDQALADRGGGNIHYWSILEP